MTPTLAIQPFIDGLELRAVHWRVLILCTLALFVDGFDVFVVGKVAPAIAAGFGQPPSAMTHVILLQQIGLAVGAFVASPLADRFGRQRMMVVCTALFGVITLLSSQARTLHELALLRGLSGIFLSGVLPMTVSLVAECTPRARRGLFIATTMAGYSAGSAAGGAVAAWFLDRWGWQSTFWIGGALPLLLVPLLIALLPESAQFLAGRTDRRRQLVSVLKQFDPRIAIAPESSIVAGDGSAVKPQRLPAAALFASDRLPQTLTLWACTFLSMGSIALLAGWVPTFFQTMGGVPIQQFALVAMLGFFGALFGTVGAGWLIDKVPIKVSVPAVFAGWALLLILLGRVPFAAMLFPAVVIAWNLFQSGSQAILNVLLTRAYPASMRSTAVGWAGGAGRLGGVVLPLFGGFAVAGQWALGSTMLTIAAAPMVVALVVLFLPLPAESRERPR